MLHPGYIQAETKKSRTIYVGSDVCQKCHEKEYDSFMKYAKKSKSYESIERVKKGLTAEEIRGCYACHTTGYGKPGGFVSVEKDTPSEERRMRGLPWSGRTPCEDNESAVYQATLER